MATKEKIIAKHTRWNIRNGLGVSHIEEQGVGNKYVY